ncbi:MAG: DUF6364 family protein [Ferruginibacter sp.]
MTTKLTLSIDDKTVKEIKVLFQKKGISISKYVEQTFLSELEKTNKPKKDIRKLIGAFGNDDKKIDWKKIKLEHLLKKHEL